jgi:hypothetical protein
MNLRKHLFTSSIITTVAIVFVLLIAAGCAMLLQKQVDLKKYGQINPVNLTDTSNLKTYRNEQYGFEIKHPSSWIEKSYIVATPSIGGVVLDVKNPLDETQSVSVSVVGQKHFSSPPGNTENSYLLGGIVATEVKFPGRCGVEKCILPFINVWSKDENSGYIYDIMFSNTTDIDSGIYQQILSTFKLTTKATLIDKVKDQCAQDNDCQFIWFTGGCHTPEYVARVEADNKRLGIDLGRAPYREGIKCACVKAACVESN